VRKTVDSMHSESALPTPKMTLDSRSKLERRIDQTIPHVYARKSNIRREKERGLCLKRRGLLKKSIVCTKHDLYVAANF
jgi:hypothetical protein